MSIIIVAFLALLLSATVGFGRRASNTGLPYLGGIVALLVVLLAIYLLSGFSLAH